MASQTQHAEPALVVAVDARQMTLRTRSGEECALRFTGEWVASQPSTAEERVETAENGTTDSPVVGSAGGLSDTNFGERIHQVDESHYTFQTGFVRAILENGGEAVTGVEIEPTGLDSAPGARISGEEGVYRYLGLAKGDILQSSNGTAIRDVDDLVHAFMGVAPGRPAVIRVRRGDRDIAIQYSGE